MDRNKNHYWVWQFEITDEDVAGTKLRTNTGLGDDQLWALKRMFDAFGVKPNVDTEKLVGQEIKILVDQQPMTGGPRAGQLRNEIIEPMPLSSGDDEDEEWGDDEDKDEKDGEEDDDF